MLSEDNSKIITRSGTNPNPFATLTRPAKLRSQDQTYSGQRLPPIPPGIKSNNPVHEPVTEHPPGTAENDPTQFSRDTITHEMSIAEVLERLSRHGCKDITEELDLSKFSEYPISSGGYGDVYRGALHNGQLVAVKCLRLHMDSTEISEKQLKRAARELYVWSKCDHPNVLGLVGVGQYRNQIAMVSPWMEYGNVRRLLGLKPQTDRYEMCLQVANGIAYLHSAEVVHGDIKGDNVLVSGDLVPKVADFGNAALREYTLQFSKTTSKAGMSLNWVAPEVFDETTGPTAEADVYSLGMTIFEIITGSPPYAGLREPVIMRMIMGGVHPTRPEEHIPTGTKHADLLWSTLRSCWTFAPEGRPTSGEVRDKMEEIVSEREKDMGSGEEKAKEI